MMAMEHSEDSKLFDDYQKATVKTAVYPGQGTIFGIYYLALKLNGEAGEVGEKVGKTWRDDNSVITEEKQVALLLELGDVLWYITMLARDLGFLMSEVAQANLDKIHSRLERGTIKGSGDNR
jgi:NTP pyrophosphatase (non-canonical NTP hydrolase)